MSTTKKIKNEIVALFQPIEREGGFPLYARVRERIRKFRTIFNDKNTNGNFKRPMPNGALEMVLQQGKKLSYFFFNIILYI